MRFVVPARSIYTGYNSKYFGSEKGLTYYNFVSDQFTGFHFQTVPGTLRDSLYVLSGLLENKTTLQVKELMSDTAGYSDVVFGLFHLLGYLFSPRLKDFEGVRWCGQARRCRFAQDGGSMERQITVHLTV